MNQRKVFTVDNLAQKLNDAKSLVLADYRGLTVAQITELREKVKESGGELEVVKNTLLRRAAQQAKIEIDDQVLSGPTIALWAYEDEIQPIKVLDKFAQVTELPKVKFGLFDGRPISLEQIKVLAKLPGIEQLRAKLAGTLQSPIYGLVNNLQGNIRKLVLTLDAIFKKKQPN